MNERLTIKSFGPVKDIDITFKKVTVFIGDQGTGKSCVSKLFSMFKWLEKALITEKYSPDYFEKYVDARFRRGLCAYNRLEEFFHKDTYIKFRSDLYTFVYENEHFHVIDSQGDFVGLPKIMYVPAERIILSSAEKKLKSFDGLPASNMTFNQRFWEAKDFYKEGYKLPFADMSYKYDKLNDVSWVVGNHYRVRLTNASSGIQSALPLCMVSEHLETLLMSGSERPLSYDELMKIQKETSKIMDNPNLSETVKDSMLRHLSSRSRYDCLINVVEEPELSLFPDSQMEVLKTLCKVNNSRSNNTLVITTHSPYSLSILNNLVMAGMVYSAGSDEIKASVEKVVPKAFHVSPAEIAAYRLSIKDRLYCKSIVGELSRLISKNDLDTASQNIMGMFNTLYRLYAKAQK